MSTLFKLSQTNFMQPSLNISLTSICYTYCQDKKLRQEVCYPCGCLVCLASCVCLSPPPPPAARWVFLPPSSSFLERARVTFPRPTQLACCSLSSAGSTIRLPLSLPPSPAPLMRAGRPGSGRRGRERRQRDEGGRGKEAHQFIRPTAPPFHFAQEPTSRRDGGAVARAAFRRR